MSADQFCLRWNNFQLNIASALDSLKTDEDLVDVTLSCEGQSVKAHKVVLSACSPYFRGVFKENPCQHPIVILKDVSYDDVSALLSFMYQGEVYITQDRLASFLHTAELLQVRGLTGATNPFKDAPKQCRTKKPVMTSGTPIRHDTPPLSSPPSIPMSLPTHPVPTKEPPSSFSLIQNKMAALNSSTTLHQTSTVTQPPAYTSTQQYHSAPSVEQPSYQQPPNSSQLQQSVPSGGESSQQYHHSSDTEQSTNRSSSPQPHPAKRRKAVPRRVSVGGQLSAEETTDSQDGEKTKSKSGDETSGCDVSGGSVPVKQEPEEDSIFEVDATMEEESNPISFSNVDDETMESPSSDSTKRLDFYGNVETTICEEQSGDLKEEMVEGSQIMVPHSMLLRSLSGPKQSTMLGSASPSRISDGMVPTRPLEEADGANHNVEEIFGMQSWSSNKTHGPSDLFILSESVSIINRHQFNSVKQRRSSMENHTVYEGTPQPVYRPRQSDPSANSKNSLYQQRKHSWRSRRPVQCPNCQKIITMAYNLKSHLATCLKRNGIRSSKVVQV